MFQNIDDITFLLVIKNIVENGKQSLFSNVICQCKKLSSCFLIIDNGSSEKSSLFLEETLKRESCDYRIISDSGFVDLLYTKYIDKVKTEYVFLLADDELLTDGLVNEIKVNIGKYEVFNIRQKTMFISTYIDDNFYPKLFKKEYSPMNKSEKVHDMYDFNFLDGIRKEGRLYSTNFFIEHMSYYQGISLKLFSKTLFYIENEAENLYVKDPCISDFKILCLMFRDMSTYFLFYLFKFKNYKTFEGIFYSFFSTFYFFLKYLKYYEIKKSKKG